MRTKKLRIMSTLRNRVQLIGRVGKDPEIVDLENGKKMAKFSLATTENYVDKRGERIEMTNWHQVSFWNGSVPIIEKMVSKGIEIAVEGKLSSRSWEDMNGNRHYFTQIIGYNLILMGRKERSMVEQ